MHSISEKSIVDNQGNRTAVVLDLNRYRELLEVAEEFESVRSFDDALSSADESIPFDQAMREIEGEHE